MLKRRKLEVIFLIVTILVTFRIFVYARYCGKDIEGFLGIRP